MAVKAGLVGLPNVGKSTLFNAITKAGVAAENYPFCTVDPHIAITDVPDKRLLKLARIFHSQKIIPASAQFVDIAGLVKGASQGEGLGNQFLGHIMEVDLILHVLRCFEDDDITHVHNIIDPIDDFETIYAELMLKDLESAEKRKEKLSNLLKNAKNRGVSPQEIKEMEQEQTLVEQVIVALGSDTMETVRALITKAAAENIKTVPLLSAKDYLIIANLSEDDFANQAYVTNKHFQALVEKFGSDRVIPVSAQIEAELAQLADDDAQEMMSELGITESGLAHIITKSYQYLQLITFYTCGPKEAHAWSISKGEMVQKAAGVIHSDLERGFICAEVFSSRDILELGSEAAVKNAGKLRTEGKTYIVQDGDIIHVRFNV